MNYPEDIAELESELERVLKMEAHDERAMSNSDRPEVEKIFLASTRKIRSDLQKRLRIAKAERAHEVVRLRLDGARLETGTLPLRLVANFVEPFNAVLERSAWRYWDRAGDASRIDPKFIRQLDLRLVGLETGSTQLIILGNTSPDLSGISALESALRDIFDLLNSDVETLADRVHAIGIGAGRSLAAFLSRLESENVAIELEWPAPEGVCRWDGRPNEVTRVRSLLEEIGEPTTSRENIQGTVDLLSIRNRLEIQNNGTGEKIRVSYHSGISRLVCDLRLGDTRVFEIERTVYPFVISKKKCDTFRLINIIGESE